jgi:hypothetical protein
MNNAKTRLENQIEEGQRLLEVTSLPKLEDLHAYQDRICEWRNATYALLEDIYDHQSTQSNFCPMVEKSELRDEARDKLKADVSMILDGLRDLLPKM